MHEVGGSKMAARLVYKKNQSEGQLTARSFCHEAMDRLLCAKLATYSIQHCDDAIEFVYASTPTAVAESLENTLLASKYLQHTIITDSRAIWRLVTGIQPRATPNRWIKS
jgi:hypothetical protein